MPQPDIVPDKLKNPLSKRMLIGIGVIVIGFHLLINFYMAPDNGDDAVLVFSISTPLAASIIGIVVALRYAGAKVFQKAHIFLAIGYFGIFLGEVTYLVYDLYYPDLDPYPSIADVFFFIQYPMILMYLFLNISFFSPKLSNKSKIWIIGVPILVLAIFTMLSQIQSEGNLFENFDFWYGVIFVSASASTLSVGVIGASIFKGGTIGKAWLLLVIGILFNTAGDVWYYHLELFDEYSLGHPVNLFWYAGYLLVIYALIKHKNTL
jgi:hypothetical protein